METIVKNNVKISKMTLGTVQLGMNYGVNNGSGKPTEEQSFRILDAAYDGGVTMLDTSDDYGESEAIIGRYLKSNPDKHFEICTKFNVSKENEGNVYNTLKEFAQKSIKKLSIETIPIFMSHKEQNFFECGEELVDALARLKKDGIILSSAISMSNKDSLGDIVKTGGFDAIQMPMNILDNKELQNGMVENMSKDGIAVFIRSVYLQGLFFRKDEDLINGTHGILKCALPYVKKMREIAADNGLSTAELALLFIRDAAGVDSIVVGSETEDQVKENVELFNKPKLSDDVINTILKEFNDVDPFVISPWLWVRKIAEIEGRN